MHRIAILKRIVDNVEHVIIDKREKIELALITLMCGGHILIEDVPGVGKTSLSSSMARSLSCSFNRIQFTPDIMPSDITGFSVFNPKMGEFEYREGAIMSQIVLADEINRTSPKTQSSLLEAMEEQQVTVDGMTYPLPQPFMVMATQNPIEHLGTYPLPEAQMDRFFMRISLGYPSRGEEVKLLTRFLRENPLDRLLPVATAANIIEIQALVEQIYVDTRISEYIVSLIRHTRTNPYVTLGSSPRGSISLYKASQAWALYNQRNYVLPDDVIYMAPHVLAHRVVLNQQAKLKKISQEDIIAMAIKSVSAPIVQNF